jgi:hypothetical protein
VGTVIATSVRGFLINHTTAVLWKVLYQASGRDQLAQIEEVKEQPVGTFGYQPLADIVYCVHCDTTIHSLNQESPGTLFFSSLGAVLAATGMFPEIDGSQGRSL